MSIKSFSFKTQFQIRTKWQAQMNKISTLDDDQKLDDQIAIWNMTQKFYLLNKPKQNFHILWYCCETLRDQ